MFICHLLLLFLSKAHVILDLSFAVILLSVSSSTQLQIHHFAKSAWMSNRKAVFRLFPFQRFPDTVRPMEVVVLVTDILVKPVLSSQSKEWKWPLKAVGCSMQIKSLLKWIFWDNEILTLKGRWPPDRGDTGCKTVNFGFQLTSILRALWCKECFMYLFQWSEFYFGYYLHWIHLF